MSIPQVSVIMAVYNERPPYLEQAVKSILAQTFTDFEYIIVDDGSDAETATLLGTLAKTDERIILIRNPANMGLTRSLNIALDRAQGTLIARMDSDDISFPERLAQERDFLAVSGADLVVAAAIPIDENGTEYPSSDRILPQPNTRDLMRGNPYTHATFFGTRSVFSERYREDFKRAQDYEFLLRIIGKGYTVNYMASAILYHRKHRKSISEKSAGEQERCAFRARLLAITSYHYPLTTSIYLFRSALLLLVPYKLKKFLCRFL